MKHRSAENWNEHLKLRYVVPEELKHFWSTTGDSIDFEECFCNEQITEKEFNLRTMNYMLKVIDYLNTP